MALTAVLALVGAVSFQQLSQREYVLVAARNIEPGDKVTATDFRLGEAAVDPSMSVVRADDRQKLNGSIATSRIPSGAVVSSQQFSSSAPSLPEGSVVVGAVLAAGEMPTPNLGVGDTVQLVQVGGQSNSDPEKSIGIGKVHSIGVPQQTAQGGGEHGSGGNAVKTPSNGQWVSLEVPLDLGPKVAQAASGGRLRLILLPAQRGQK